MLFFSTVVLRERRVFDKLACRTTCLYLLGNRSLANRAFKWHSTKQAAFPWSICVRLPCGTDEAKQLLESHIRAHKNRGLSGNANPIQKKHTSNLGPKKAHRTYLGRDQPPNISHRTFDLGLTLRTRTRTFNMGQRTQLPKLRAASLTDPNSVVPNDLIPSFSSYRTTAYSFAEGIKTFAHPSVQLVGLLTVRRVRGRG